MGFQVAKLSCCVADGLSRNINTTLESRKLKKQKRANSTPTSYAAILENEKALGMRLQRAFPADFPAVFITLICSQNVFFFHHAIRFLGHLWLKKIITESPYRPLEGVPAPPPPPPAANAHLSNGNTFLEMSTQEANENSRENLDHFWSYPPLVKTIHAFIIPPLCHFTIKGQENAQNTRPYCAVVTWFNRPITGRIPENAKGATMADRIRMFWIFLLENRSQCNSFLL